MKVFLILGALNALLAVLFGAFGAHGLKSKLSEQMLSVFETGVHYQMFHALGLILIAILAQRQLNSSLVTWAGWMLFAGIVLFSGSLYALSISGIRPLGAITPLGGVAFLIGWALLIIAAIRL